jgi:ATP-dependent protease HslVU (ClpYQ) peptidase subunit
MASDGQVTLGNRIDSYNQRKVFEVAGCLVGFAGRFSSALRFLAWFKDYMQSVSAQNMHPEVIVSIPENLIDEDFQAVVVYPDGETYLFEGGDRAFKIEQPYSIGSGADYAVAAMKAGATAEEAINIAKDLDVYSGGETFVVELAEEEPELTREDLEEMTKEELIDLLFPEDCECEDKDEEKESEPEQVEETKPKSSKLAEAIKEVYGLEEECSDDIDANDYFGVKQQGTQEEIKQAGRLSKEAKINEALKEYGVVYNKTAGVYTKGMIELDYKDSCFKFTGSSVWFKINEDTVDLMVSHMTLSELKGVCDSLDINYSTKVNKAILAERIMFDIETWTCVMDEISFE